MSSNTISLVFISTSLDSLITFALEADTKDNLSIVFLALISCIIPITVFDITIPINNAFS